MSITTAPHTVRHAGACPKCGTGIALDDAPALPTTSRTCPACGTKVTLKRVVGTYSDVHPCDDRCQYAIGPICVCACGGTNHSCGYIAPVAERPEWVVTRDAKRVADKTARAAAKAQKARQTAEQARDALTAEHPTLAHLTAYANEFGFMGDMHRAWQAGTMSPAQAAAAVRRIEGDQRAAAARAEREAAAQAAIATGVRVPSGAAVPVEGRIATIRSQQTYYGGTPRTEHKMLVVTDAGWKVWATLPSALIDAAQTLQDQADWKPWSAVLTGHVVRFVCDLSGPASEDPLFGYGSRPRRAALADA